MLKKHRWIPIFLVAALALGITFYALREPDHCALCGIETEYHAPVLMDLSTGEIGELRVYVNHPYLPGELADGEFQRNGIFQLSRGLGLQGYIDRTANAQTHHVTLPKTIKLMRSSLFCRDCRKLLPKANGTGYVLLDLHDLGNIQVYAVQDGANCTIRDYTVEVCHSKITHGIEIVVMAHLFS